jgi:hypothetical protein
MKMIIKQLNIIIKLSFLRKNRTIVVIIINNDNWYYLFSFTCEVP